MNNKMNEVKGFKMFNPDWTCRGKQYTCPGTFEEDVTPDVCNVGMHFCECLADCFNYYSDANENYHVAEVIAHGEISRREDKCCTNKLEIVREIPWSEVLQLVNIGKACTGIFNTGNFNTGTRNAGDWNTGVWNTGNFNIGNWNTGDCNIGNWNTGNFNTGSWNTGRWNTGNFNTGDFNNTFGSAGCFNTEEQPVMMFNKPSGWTLRYWMNSEARHYLYQIPKNVVEWVYSHEMTDKEKAAHPEHETTGGYLKVLDESECAQIWWDNVSEHVKHVIMDLPNFDAEIFRRCTGIKVGD